MQKRKCLIASVLVLCLLLASMCCAVSEDTVLCMRIEDGMARQIVSYTSAQSLDYSNADSEILRLVVYVETDYDTDLDGKPDLIKAVVQVPRPAAEGVYRAPVIYEARPYIAGIDLYQPSLPAPGRSGNATGPKNPQAAGKGKRPASAASGRDPAGAGRAQDGRPGT